MDQSGALRRSAVLVLILGLAACASPQATSPVASRDFRSQAFCALRAQAAGYADYDVAAACRRAERSAEIRAKTTRIDATLDKACEQEATLDHAGGPFSWRAYMRCVDDSI